MDAKITITSRCNAKCATCPVWQKPGRDMTVETFKKVYDFLYEVIGVRILINNTGDMYIHPHRNEIFDYIESRPRQNPVIMTTNAAAMDRVPKIEEIIISFNGGTKEGYERTTGLPFEKTVERIRSFYPELAQLPSLQMHCLIWKGNEGEEEAFRELWSDFPGRLRISYKYDNQHKDDYSVDGKGNQPRIFCDYLINMSINPEGRLIMCAHDFDEETNFGSLVDDDIDEVLNNVRRLTKIKEHYAGVFSGLCERCNYNTPAEDRIKVIKGRP